MFNLGSSAELTISGKVGEVTVTTSSASGFHGENYTIDKATLKASSTSRITVGDVQTFPAQASSAAGIRYKGDPENHLAGYLFGREALKSSINRKNRAAKLAKHL